MVPKTSGTRLIFGSKSSVAPVDCQTYSGCGVALVPDLAEQRVPADLGMRIGERELIDRAAWPAPRAGRRSAASGRRGCTAPVPGSVSQRPARRLVAQHHLRRPRRRSQTSGRASTPRSPVTAAPCGSNSAARTSVERLVGADRRAEPGADLPVGGAGDERAVADDVAERRDRRGADGRHVGRASAVSPSSQWYTSPRSVPAMAVPVRPTRDGGDRAPSVGRTTLPGARARLVGPPERDLGVGRPVPATNLRSPSSRYDTRCTGRAARDRSRRRRVRATSTFTSRRAPSSCTGANCTCSERRRGRRRCRARRSHPSATATRR